MDRSKTLQQFERAMHPIDRILHKFFSPTAPYLIEFLGTFMLIFVIMILGGEIPTQTSALLGPLAIGFTLMVGIFAGGHVSGAHYNPAVTLTVLLSGRSKITPRSSILYVIVQLLASIVAPLFAWAITGNTAAPSIGLGYTQWQALLVEIFWTFFLCTTVLNVATTKSQEGNSFFGHAIGFAVAAGAIAFGGISGGVFNPAVAFGPLIINAINQSYNYDVSLWDSLSYFWVYWLAAIIAGISAPLFFRITSHKEYVGSTGVAGMMDDQLSGLGAERDSLIHSLNDN